MRTHFPMQISVASLRMICIRTGTWCGIPNRKLRGDEEQRPVPLPDCAAKVRV